MAISVKLIHLIFIIATLQKSIVAIFDDEIFSKQFICVILFAFPFQTGKSFMIPKLSTLNIGTNS